MTFRKTSANTFRNGCHDIWQPFLPACIKLRLNAIIFALIDMEKTSFLLYNKGGL